MTLNIDKKGKYAYPYHVNWHYLHNMTRLQMKALEEMEWIGAEINTGLWYVPNASPRNLSKIRSMIWFVDDLDKKIKEL
jgi:hypothetical protein